MTKFELFIGCLGNGLTICNKAVQENGDYKIIAHIANHGHIDWRIKPENIPADALRKIEHESNVMYENWNKQFSIRSEISQYGYLIDHLPYHDVSEIFDMKATLSEKVFAAKQKFLARH